MLGSHPDGAVLASMPERGVGMVIGGGLLIIVLIGVVVLVIRAIGGQE
jgi:hypothetical protein